MTIANLKILLEHFTAKGMVKQAEEVKVTLDRKLKKAGLLEEPKAEPIKKKEAK